MLTRCDIRNIKRRYAAGDSTYDIAADYGVHAVSIQQRLRNAGIKPPRFSYRTKQGNYQIGEKHAKAVLTEAKVKRIRTVYATGNYSQNELARMFNVAQGAIYHIVHGSTWKHLLVEE